MKGARNPLSAVMFITAMAAAVRRPFAEMMTRPRSPAMEFVGVVHGGVAEVAARVAMPAIIVAVIPEGPVIAPTAIIHRAIEPVIIAAAVVQGDGPIVPVAVTDVAAAIHAGACRKEGRRRRGARHCESEFDTHNGCLKVV
jgi:hypothetical protein